MLTELMKKKYIDELVPKHEQVIEDKIQRLLPKNVNLKDLRWAHNTEVKGAKTLYLNNESIISLFPIETKTVEEDESIKFTVTQHYIDHTKAQKE